MKDGLRHLHELPPRAHFRFPGQDRVWRLMHVGNTHCRARSDREAVHVRFTDSTGRVKEFPAHPTEERPMAPAAEVIPLEVAP